MYDEIPGIRSVVSPGRQSEAAAPGERRYFFRYPYFDNDDVFTTRETGVFSGILAGEPTIRFDIIPAGCYRNLFAICRVKSGIPMSGERPRRSGSNAPVRFGCGCGFRPEGEGEAVIRAQTGAWFFLEIGGFLQKNGNYRSKQGCTTRNGRTYAAWRTIECITMESNASSAIRVLFPGPGRTGPDRGSDNPIPNTLCPENKKPYVSLIHKDFASCLLFFQRFSERKTGLGPATSTLARLRSQAPKTLRV